MEVDQPVEGVSEEHKLRRLLHTGITTNRLSLRGGNSCQGPYELIEASFNGINRSGLAAMTTLISARPPPGISISCPV